MNRLTSLFTIGLWTLPFVGASAGEGGGAITLESLLREMIDRDALARFPVPRYSCAQFSSYDRRSISPGNPDWFANNDRGQFIREEDNGGRHEFVLMEAKGPGCLCRVWTPIGPQNEGGTLRFYFDGAARPSLEVDFLKLMTGQAWVGEPWATLREKGGNLYLPIPYANGCKVTLDKKPFYYHFTYRTFEAGTRVETFRPDALESAQKTLASVADALTCAPSSVAAPTPLADLAPGESRSLDLPAGPAAVRWLRVQIQSPNMQQALRETILRAEFDGEPTVWAPAGDFFGSGVGLNPLSSWSRTVRADGSLESRWTMPYQKSGRLLLDNLGDEPVACVIEAQTEPWTWDDRSLHFHAAWRQQSPIPTDPRIDWNYLEAQGEGVYIGDNLAVFNPVAQWWGEGDEKIYVDRESFPSHFGTGTEDYYGYAWGGKSNGIFSLPFVGQVRCDGPTSRGHTTLYRERALDAIPFRRSLRFDMEVWHHTLGLNVAYAATTFWYARPGARCNIAPLPDEATRAIPEIQP